MRTYTIFCFLFILFLSNLVVAQSIEIKGTIKGVKNDTLKIVLLPCRLHSDNIISAALPCINGEFSFNTNLKEPILHLVQIKIDGYKNICDADDIDMLNQDIRFFISPGDNLRVLAKLEDNCIQHEVFGSNLSEQRNVFESELYPYILQNNRHCLKYNDATKNQDEKRMKKEYSGIKTALQNMDNVTLKLVLNHPDWEYSAIAIQRLPVDTIAKYYYHLDQSIQSSFGGKYTRSLFK